MGGKAAALWLSLALAVGVAAAGTTMALFGAHTGTSIQTITTGTLTLTSIRDRGEPGPGPLFYVGASEGVFPTGLWQPGDSHWHILHVFNTGSLDAALQGVRATLRGGDTALGDWLRVRITSPDPADPNSQVEVANTSLHDLLAGTVPLSYPSGDPVLCFAGDLTELRFYVSMPLQAPNAMQGRSIQLDLTVYGEQLR